MASKRAITDEELTEFFNQAEFRFNFNFQETGLLLNAVTEISLQMEETGRTVFSIGSGIFTKAEFDAMTRKLFDSIKSEITAFEMKRACKGS